MNKFPLKHLLLYSKGWYKTFHPKSSRKTIWDDMKMVFTADNYDGKIMTKSDMISVLLRHCQNLKVQGFELFEFANGISEANAWKVPSKEKWNIRCRFKTIFWKIKTLKYEIQNDPC